ncbi:MAG: alanine racemase [Lacisediminihabitans sp.]
MTEAIINLCAYRQNLSMLTASVAPSALMAVVKANAYGHGLLPIANAAIECGIRWLGTVDISTALELRAAGIGAPTSIFAWQFTPREDYRAAIEANVDLGISTLNQLEQIAQARAGVPARLHLKIDTGLHRNGALASEWPQLVRRALELERAGTAIVYAVWTHIAEASDDDDSVAIARFHEAVGVATSLGAHVRLLHLAASAAGLARTDSRFDLVRMGAFGYGISPGSGVTPAQLGLVPVMTLASETVVGVDGEVFVPIGYGDGISSRASGVVDLLVNGTLQPVEEVKFDRITLRDKSVPSGAEVILFGTGSRGEWTLQQWADSTGTIGEEIVNRLGRHIRRRYVGGSGTASSEKRQSTREL